MSPRRLANLIIAGVNKAGTTSLFTYLSKHSDICAAGKKETCYFLPLRYGGQLPHVSEYEDYFSHCKKERYIMESTPGYFYGGRDIAETIKEKLREVRIIIILRDPIDRAFSFYKKRRNRQDIGRDMSFDDYIKACERLDILEIGNRENNTYFGIRGGCYSDFIEDWFETFGNSLKVLFFDDLKNDVRGLLKRVCRWLDIDSCIYNEIALDVENKAVDYKLGSFHKLAYDVCDKGERFFRSHANVKKRIRKIYWRINAKPFEEAMSTFARQHLNSVYTPYNKKLSAQLSKRGYSGLPGWLT